MNNPVIETLFQNQYFIILLVLWEIIWKGLAVWKSAKRNEKAFFIAILIFNTFGLLPICYLIYRYLTEKKVSIKTRK